MKAKFWKLIAGAAFLLLSGRNLGADTWLGQYLARQWMNAAWKIGPFHIQPALVLSNAGYDSNIYYSPNPVRDFTLTAGPSFNTYLFIGQRIMLQASDSIQYAYFKEQTQQRSWNNYFSGQVHFILYKAVVSVGGRSIDARERWSTEVDIRPRRQERGLQGSLLWQMTPLTSLSLNYRITRYRYEDVEYEWIRLRDYLNRDESYLNTQAYCQLSYWTRLLFDGEYGLFRFENPASGRDAKSYGVYGALEFAPLGMIRGRIRLGYKFFDSKDPGKPDFKGLVGDTNVSCRLFGFLALRARYKRDVQFSIWYDNTFYIENSAGGGASFYFFRNIRIDYDYSKGINNYAAGGLSREGIQTSGERKDLYIVHSVGLYYRLRENIGIGVTAGQWNRERRWDFHENIRREYVSMNLTYDF